MASQAGRLPCYYRRTKGVQHGACWMLGRCAGNVGGGELPAHVITVAVPHAVLILIVGAAVVNHNVAHRPAAGRAASAGLGALATGAQPPRGCNAGCSRAGTQQNVVMWDSSEHPQRMLVEQLAMMHRCYWAVQARRKAWRAQRASARCCAFVLGSLAGLADGRRRQAGQPHRMPASNSLRLSATSSSFEPYLLLRLYSCGISGRNKQGVRSGTAR